MDIPFLVALKLGTTTSQQPISCSLHSIITLEASLWRDRSMYPNIQEVLLPFQPNKIAFEKLLLKEAFPAPVSGFSFFFFKHHTLEHGHFFSFLPTQYLDAFDWDTDDHWTDFCTFVGPRISDLQTLLELERQTMRAQEHHHQRIVSQWLAHHPQACLLWQYGDPYLSNDIDPFNYLLSYDADLYLLLTHLLCSHPPPTPFPPTTQPRCPHHSPRCPRIYGRPHPTPRTGRGLPLHRRHPLATRPPTSLSLHPTLWPLHRCLPYSTPHHPQRRPSPTRTPPQSLP